LNAVNRRINSNIVPKLTATNGFDEWLIAPAAGDCKAYALTKRHELLARGWPLLLSEVIVADGEHHLVLVVRTKETDLVLDNLNPNVRPVSATYRQYQWLRVEMPQNPKFWVRVRTLGAVRTAALSRHVF
jgi:predicted transglutaminase-like cysteine proteinase